MRRTLLVAAVLVSVAGCSKKKEAAPQAMPPMGAMPPGAQKAAAPSLKGKVLERADASIYTYLKLQTANGEIWAAVPQTDTAVGADVEIVNPQAMDGFESKTLNKKFDKIVFGALPGQADAAKPSPHGGMAAMMQGQAQPPQGEVDPKVMAENHAKIAAGPSTVEVKAVPKATGADARTVAEVWANRAALKEKTVTVHAQVVKVTPGVMGKTWLHLRDGSGDAEKKDNDLTVTAADGAGAAVGDVVTVSGKVAVDRDFGSGYAYPVIVEEAKVTK